MVCPSRKARRGVRTVLSSSAIWHPAPCDGSGRRLGSRGSSRTQGSANAVQLTSDGGIDFRAYAGALNLTEESCPPYGPVPPGIQRVTPDGEVSDLCAGDVLASNDLIVDRDGTIYFTGPERPSATADRRGRVMALEPGSRLRVITSDFRYDNGIALSPDGADSRGRSGWAEVGEVIRLLEGSLVTNVCFGESDLRTLFAVEIAPGRLHAIENMPCAGLASTPWPMPAGQITVSR